ncbi:MAG: hypothetical protein MK212_08375 [Saprospiraceae bacterium]|nr:hypothetical protein [Saprospiraceae bacterium]
MDKFDENNPIQSSFICKEENIPNFIADEKNPQAGFALLHNIGDLDNDGGEEIGYVMQWLDQSNLNTYHIISLKNGVWKKLYSFPIRDYQLPKLPGVYTKHTAFGNSNESDPKMTEAEKMTEDLVREKALSKFKGFVRKQSLFNILVHFVNDNGEQEYALWKITHKDIMPVTDLPEGASFLIQDDQVLLPSFRLDIKTTAEVAQLLADKKEEILVSVTITGTPTKRPLDEEAKQYLGDYEDEMILGDTEFKLDKAGQLVLDELRVPRVAFENLKSPNVNVNLTIVSSRKSSKLNLFHAQPHTSGEILEMRNKTHSVTIEMLE